MTIEPGKCPLTQKQLIDKFFMEARSQVLDVAAFLDRLDRSRGDEGAADDFRYQALMRSIACLSEDLTDGARVDRILMLLSDPRTDLLEERDQQQADGASEHATGDAL